LIAIERAKWLAQVDEVRYSIVLVFAYRWLLVAQVRQRRFLTLLFAQEQDEQRDAGNCGASEQILLHDVPLDETPLEDSPAGVRITVDS